MADQDGSDVVRRDRFSGGPARGFLSSLAADKRIFAADLAVDRAHVVMLAEQGIISAATAGKILTALSAVEEAGHEALPDGEDVHAAIETAVINRVGPEGGRMHTARSRNDEVATCIRYRLRSDLLSVLETTLDGRAELLTAAQREATTVMPGYTHLQPAQPITVGFWLASYVSALRRDSERLMRTYERVNQSPLGAAAFAGTTFDIDRQRTAALLGFDGVIENAMDAVASRDVLVDALGTLTTIGITVSGLAADGIIFAHRGFMEPADAYASTSSIMPQKKNPDTLELARASAGEAIGGMTQLTSTLKGLPRAYNRDLQNASPPVWETIDAVAEAVEVAGGAIATADWNDELLAAAAGDGFTTATGVADRLAQAGIPFRTAHEIVATAAEAVQKATTEEEAIAALNEAGKATIEQPVTEIIDTKSLAAALDPVQSVQERDSYGGPAPGQLTAAIQHEREDIETHRSLLEEYRSQLAAARTQRNEVIGTYV